MIDYLELAASMRQQLEYERVAPPYVNVPYEVINQWEDWVCREQTYSDVFSVDEIRAISEFWPVWEVVTEAVPDSYPSLAEVQALPEWDLLESAAISILRVFSVRGRLSEGVEAH